MIKTIRIFLVVVLFFLVSHSVCAQAGEVTGQNIPQNTTFISEELDYALPFPGILSDNPLYFIKKIRDTVMRAFMSNPVKRAEFALLQSDKYLAMAMAYADMKKWDRAGEAVILSQKEMEQAIAEVNAARTSGVPVPGHITTSMERSTVKHKQRIDGMKINSQEKPNGLFQKASDAFALLAAQASALREE